MLAAHTSGLKSSGVTPASTIPEVVSSNPASCTVVHLYDLDQRQFPGKGSVLRVGNEDLQLRTTFKLKSQHVMER